MVDEVLNYLSLNVDEDKKLSLIKKVVMDFCTNEEGIFQCYRYLKYLQLELMDLLDEEYKVRTNQKVIKKVLKILMTELEIIKMKLSANQDPREEQSTSKSSAVLSPLKWTDSKTDLVELMYAIKTSINQGEVTIKHITMCFEQLFQVKLGNVYDIIEDISSRKIERTKYLNKLVRNLNRVFEEMDS